MTWGSNLQHQLVRRRRWPLRGRSSTCSSTPPPSTSRCGVRRAARDALRDPRHVRARARTPATRRGRRGPPGRRRRCARNRHGGTDRLHRLGLRRLGLLASLRTGEHQQPRSKRVRRVRSDRRTVRGPASETSRSTRSRPIRPRTSAYLSYYGAGHAGGPATAAPAASRRWAAAHRRRGQQLLGRRAVHRAPQGTRLIAGFRP